MRTQEWLQQRAVRAHSHLGGRIGIVASCVCTLAGLCGTAQSKGARSVDGAELQQQMELGAAVVPIAAAMQLIESMGMMQTCASITNEANELGMATTAGQGRALAAVECYEDASELGGNTCALFFIGQLYSDLGMRRKAVRMFDRQADTAFIHCFHCLRGSDSAFPCGRQIPAHQASRGREGAAAGSQGQGGPVRRRQASQPAGSVAPRPFPHSARDFRRVELCECITVNAVNMDCPPLSNFS